jgi:hypothetical protein
MFNDFPDLSVATGRLANACTGKRAGTAPDWDWDGDMLLYPDYYKITIQYPTAENFRSYSGLLGTDGRPVGDLSFQPAALNFLTNGGFGSSAGWTNLFDLAGTVGDSTTFDFNYATVPTGGDAPGLRMTGAAAGWVGNPNSAIYQAVSLTAGKSYWLSGVIQVLPGSSNYWCEGWLVDVLPTAGKDITVANYPNAKKLAGLSGWASQDANYNGPLSGLSTPSVAFTVPTTGTYYLAIKSGCGAGSMDILLDNLSLNADVTGVKNEAASVVKTFSLQQNYPNPFNPSTNFTYQIGKAGFVSVKIYDLLGREVATLVNEFKQAGSYPATWNAASFGSGIYFCKMQSGSFTSTKKMILMK